MGQYMQGNFARTGRRSGPTYGERYRSRFKGTFIVCAVLNLVGALVRMGLGDSASLLLSPSPSADVGWAMLVAVQLFWGAVYALPINVLVAAFPVRAPKYD